MSLPKVVLTIIFSMLIAGFVYYGPVYVRSILGTDKVAESSQNEPHVVDDDIVLHYGKYNKYYNVELVVQPDGRTILQVVLTEGDIVIHDDMLNYLRNEVLHIVCSNEPIPIVNSEYKVLFLYGKPIWGPYGTMGKNYYSSNLYFGKCVAVLDKVIYLVGRSEEEQGVDGYRDWRPDLL